MGLLNMPMPDAPKRVRPVVDMPGPMQPRKPRPKKVKPKKIALDSRAIERVKAAL